MMLGWITSWLRPAPILASAPAPDEPASVRRARSVVGQGRYALGRGGRAPDAATPFDRNGEADCSGFLSWAIGLDRKSDAIDGGWISTDSIARDATGPRRMFQLVEPGEDVRPSDVVVYPGRYVAGRRLSIGHVGLVVAVPDGWRYEGPTSLAGLRVVHCASSRAPGGGAVRESSGAPWARRGIVVRLR